MSAELGDNQSNEQKLDDPESSTNTDVVVAKEQPNNEEEVTIDREGTQGTKCFLNVDLFLATTTTTIDLPEQQEADIQDSAATGLTTDNLNVAHINRHQSSARSLNPDSPGS